MRKTKIAVSLMLAGGLVSPVAYATNGDEMMSVGSQNTALGGTGVANYSGAESTFANPAMLGKSKGQEVYGGLTLFKPKVTNTGFAGTEASSSANTFYIPDVSYSSRTSDNLTWGIAMAGIAGMGVDYTGAPVNSFVSAKTSLSIAKVVPTIAYNQSNYGIGFSPVLQYGTLSIAYNASGMGSINYNPGTSSATGIGFSLGGYYDVTPTVTVAAAYNSSISMKYGTQLSGAGKGFGQTFADKLAQPAEIKAGVAYSASGITLTADYKVIQWSSADGYKEFGWKNQNVLAVGGKYAGEGYWVGLGYNHADNPIAPFQDGTITPAGNNAGVVNLFNNLMFPATVKNSFTFGGGYSFAPNFGIDAAAVITPKVTTTVDVSDAAKAPPGTVYNTTTHSQQSFSVSLRYKF